MTLPRHDDHLLAQLRESGAAGHERAKLCDECLLAPSTSTPRVQEAHLVACDLICDLVERGIVATPGG